MNYVFFLNYKPLITSLEIVNNIGSLRTKGKNFLLYFLKNNILHLFPPTSSCKETYTGELVSNGNLGDNRKCEVCFRETKIKKNKLDINLDIVEDSTSKQKIGLLVLSFKLIF